jgi:hypothetical protein
MISRFILLLLIGCGCASAAPAIRALAWDYEVAERKLALVSGESATEITGMHPMKRTGPIRIKGKGPFVVRALDRNPGADGKPIDRPVTIPESVQYPLLVVMPDEKHATGVRLMVVDDNPAGFRWGSFRFLNATPKDLVVQMEQKAVKVPTGWKTVDLDLGGERRGVGARVALAEAISKPLYTAVWEYNEEVRTLCFLVPGDDPRLSPVMFKAIPEDKLALQLENETLKPDTDP